MRASRLPPPRTGWFAGLSRQAMLCPAVPCRAVPCPAAPCHAALIRQPQPMPSPSAGDSLVQQAGSQLQVSQGDAVPPAQPQALGGPGTAVPQPQRCVPRGCRLHLQAAHSPAQGGKLGAVAWNGPAGVSVGFITLPVAAGQR